MANKKQRKEKVKAKQDLMRERESWDEEDRSRQVEAALLEERESQPDSKKTNAAVRAALDSVRQGEEIDPRLLQLFKDFRLYRVIVVAFVVAGLAVLLVCMWMKDTGLIDETVQNNGMILSAIIVFAGCAISFGRARPIREDINAWSKVNALALKETGGKHGATSADIDKIFLARARNKRIPPTPEFRRVRRVWMFLIGCAVALMAVAVLMAPQSMEDVTLPVILIMVSCVLLVAATIYDRRCMKPLREAWEREMNAKVKKASKEAKRQKR